MQDATIEVVYEDQWIECVVSYRTYTEDGTLQREIVQVFYPEGYSVYQQRDIYKLVHHIFHLEEYHVRHR